MLNDGCNGISITVTPHTVRLMTISISRLTRKYQAIIPSYPPVTSRGSLPRNRSPLDQETRSSLTTPRNRCSNRLLDSGRRINAYLLDSMKGDSGLWHQVHAAFEFHRKKADPNAQAAMDRVAAKCIGSSTPVSFNATNCLLREELLSSVSLHELTLYHKRGTPYHRKAPIVVLLHKGKKIVIDGNTRVNAWIAHGDKGPFSAIIVEPKTNAV